MASLIPGYEYDIFISYRQKDNKGDRWVSEFVEALKTELESTFKEEVSVYFDINPHDGLLETHDVDASLKEKLKCAVFVPVISRTYCDPKSFAWVHEFKTFIEQASKDQYGLKVKLAGGNVANRVLPVQIHDLDQEDKKLVESELGGFIRGIEFIYKEPGVNRPLMANEDHPDNNLNKTFYRNQINKVANAIKEIISGLKNPDHSGTEISNNLFEEKPTVREKRRTKILALVLILAMIIVPGYLIIPGLIKPVAKLEKSIAVLPFHNYSEDQNQEYMSDGLTDEIINHLYKIKSFDRVVPFPSVLIYKGTDKTMPRISTELKANYILQGTYKKIGDQIRVTAHLIDPKKDKILWQSDYDRPYSAREIITIQADIALQIASQLQVSMTDSEARNIQSIGTTNQKAFEELRKVKSIFLARGRFSELADSGLRSAQRAFELDPGYADAYAYAGLFSLAQGGYFGAGGHDFQSVAVNALFYCEKALALNQNNAIAHAVMGYLNLFSQLNFIRSEEEFKKAIDLEPNNMYPIDGYLDFLMKMGRYEDANSIKLRMAKEPLMDASDNLFIIYRTGRLKNEISSYNFNSIQEDMRDLEKGETYFWLNQYDSSIIYINNGTIKNSLVGSTPKFRTYLAIAYYNTGKKLTCNEILKQLIVKSDQTKIGSPDLYLGGYYSAINMKDSAFYWLEKAFANRSPEISWLKADPLFDNLRDDPRYRDLYKRAGFEVYDDYMKSKKN